VQLKDILSRVRLRRGKKERDTAIDAFTVLAEEIAQGRAAGLKVPSHEALSQRGQVRAGYAYHPDAASPRGRRNRHDNIGFHWCLAPARAAGTRSALNYC
jgi:hypothetical protein